VTKVRYRAARAAKTPVLPNWLRPSQWICNDYVDLSDLLECFQMIQANLADEHLYQCTNHWPMLPSFWWTNWYCFSCLLAVLLLFAIPKVMTLQSRTDQTGFSNGWSLIVNVTEKLYLHYFGNQTTQSKNNTDTYVHRIYLTKSLTLPSLDQIHFSCWSHNFDASKVSD